MQSAETLHMQFSVASKLTGNGNKLKFRCCFPSHMEGTIVIEGTLRLQQLSWKNSLNSKIVRGVMLVV